MTNYNTNTYRAMIGSLNTRQFGILQKYLEKVNEDERMRMLYRQLEKEIEMEEQAADIEDDVEVMSSPRLSL